MDLHIIGGVPVKCPECGCYCLELVDKVDIITNIEETNGNLFFERLIFACRNKECEFEFSKIVNGRIDKIHMVDE